MLDIKHRFTCGDSDLSEIIKKCQNIMVRIADKCAIAELRFYYSIEQKIFLFVHLTDLRIFEMPLVFFFVGGEGGGGLLQRDFIPFFQSVIFCLFVSLMHFQAH